MKKILAITLAAIFALTCLVGCKKEDKPFDYKEADLSKYVTLGEYLEIKIEVEDEALTEEDIENGIDEILSENAEQIKVTDRAVKDGDTVNINFVGKKDGVAFDGGTANGQPLVIGSDSFIDGFEDGLVGVMPGATVDLNLTFPTNYHNADLAGAAVVFTVTVNHIEETKVPEWNDEFVNTLTEGKYTTADAYLEEVKKDLAEAKKLAIKNKKLQDMWTKILGNCTIIEYPESEITKYYDEIIASYQAYADQYQVDLDTFLSYAGTNMEELEKYADSYAHSLVAEELVYHAIVKAENLTLSEEEKEEGLKDYAEYYGTTVEKLLEDFEEDQINDSLLWDKMLTYLLEYTVEVPATEE